MESQTRGVSRDIACSASILNGKSEPLMAIDSSNRNGLTSKSSTGVFRRIWDKAISLINGRNLGQRTIRGGVFIIAGEAYGSLLRLAANLVMTRLLYPEAFGLMLIVNLVVLALGMLSDVGVRGALITKQGDIDDKFLDTGWSMMVIRGGLLGLTTLALAVPVASYYEEPQLVGLLCIAAVGPVLQGLSSPYPILAEKSVLIGRVVFWRTASTTVAMCISLVWMYLVPSIWVLAWVGVLSTAAVAGSSYFFFPSRRPKFQLDRESFNEIFRFGRWVFLSTMLTFVVLHGDGLILSHLLSVEQLGVFSIAAALYKLVSNIIGKINAGLLLPVYAEIRKGTAEGYVERLTKIKIAIFGFTSPVLFALAIFGQYIIAFMYDPRYHGAGDIVQVVSAGMVFFVAGSSIQMIPLSNGDSFRHMVLQFIRAVLLISAMLIGGSLAGFEGLVIGIGLAHALYYPVLRIGVAKYYRHSLSTDLLYIVIAYLIIIGGWMLLGWPSVA